MRRNKTHFLRILCASCVAPLLVASCGGNDEGTPSNDPLRAAVIDALMNDADSSSAIMTGIVTEEKSACVADQLLAQEAFRDDFQAALDKGAANSDLLDAVPDPGNDPEVLRTLFNCLTTQDFVEMFTSEADLKNAATDEQKICLTAEFDAIDRDVFIGGIVAFSADKKDDEGASLILAAMIKCLGIENFG